MKANATYGASPIGRKYLRGGDVQSTERYAKDDRPGKRQFSAGGRQPRQQLQPRQSVMNVERLFQAGPAFSTKGQTTCTGVDCHKDAKLTQSVEANVQSKPTAILVGQDIPESEAKKISASRPPAWTQLPASAGRRRTRSDPETSLRPRHRQRQWQVCRDFGEGVARAQTGGGNCS